jgi:hypothetical protein
LKNLELPLDPTDLLGRNDAAEDDDDDDDEEEEEPHFFLV